MAGPPRAERVEIFAVDVDAVQLSWGHLGPGRVEVAVGDDVRELHPDGPGAVTITGLEPDRPGEVEVRGPGVPGGRISRAFRTRPALPGPELHRFATVSDLHLGCRQFGRLPGVQERPQPDEPYTLRTARAALDAAERWGARHLVAKGDVTHRGLLDQWLEFGDLIAGRPYAVEVVPGNHDVEKRRELDPMAALSKLGLETAEAGVRWVDVAGLRLVLLDSTRLGERRGHLDHLHGGVQEALASTEGPVWIGLHHQLEPHRFSTIYPPGVRGPEARRFLDLVAATHPRAFVSSGHTHRNRRRTVGGITLTEVGAPEDYPGTWAAYTVHEGGMRQVLWRLEDPQCLPWLEYTRRTLLTSWGRWSPGVLGDRCFEHRWR